MALLFQYLPLLVLVAIGFYTFKWTQKIKASVIPTNNVERDALNRTLLIGVGIRVAIAVVAFMLANSINTNYGPRFKAEPMPIVQSVTVDKDGEPPVIRDEERKPRLTAEQSEKRTREMLDWKAAHAKRDAELAAQKEGKATSGAVVE